MSLTPEDIEFNALLLEKRHKELLKALSSLATSLQKKEDDGLKALIERLSRGIELLAKQQKEDKQQNIDLSPLTNSMEELSKWIAENREKKEWEIIFKRDNAGYLQSPITFTQK